MEEGIGTAVDQLAAQACEGALHPPPERGPLPPPSLWTPLPAAANASGDDALGLVLRGLPPVECVPEETNRPRLDGFLKDAEIIVDELPPIEVGDGFTVELKNLLGPIVIAHTRRRYER